MEVFSCDFLTTGEKDDCPRGSPLTSAVSLVPASVAGEAQTGAPAGLDVSLVESGAC